MPERLARTLELRYVNVNQVIMVDIVNERFAAVFTMQLVSKGGANDPFLTAKEPQSANPDSVFPMDADGKPAFRPSLGWYAQQLDFNNSISFEQLSSKVMAQGDDLLIHAQFRGTWTQRMEIRMFPFDSQLLTISLALNCRTTGPMPVMLVVERDARLVVADEGFAPIQVWRYQPALTVTNTLVGSEGRQFPTLLISATITRRPGYIAVNVLVPLAIMPPVTLVAITIPPSQVAERLSITFTMLLTAAAYKIVVASLLPAVSYLTLCDHYVMGCTLGIIVLAVQFGLVGRAEQGGWVEDIVQLDNVLAACFAGLYVLMNAVFWLRARRLIVAAAGSKKNMFFHQQTLHFHNMFHKDGALSKVAPE